MEQLTRLLRVGALLLIFSSSCPVFAEELWDPDTESLRSWPNAEEARFQLDLRAAGLNYINCLRAQYQEDADLETADARDACAGPAAAYGVLLPAEEAARILFTVSYQVGSRANN